MNTAQPLELIVRADDIGTARSVNLGVLDAVENGIVRNVSVMAVGPELEHAATLFAARKDIAIGLHVTINAEWSQVRWRPAADPSSVSSLLETDGTFTREPMVLHERGFSISELRVEVEAQLRRLREVGFEPVYLDTHMGFDWLAGVSELLDAICQREGLVRDSVSTHPRLPGSGCLVERISDASGGPYVVITHPARPGSDVDLFFNDVTSAGAVAQKRNEERLALCDPELLNRVRAGQLILRTYSERGKPTV